MSGLLTRRRSMMQTSAPAPISYATDGLQLYYDHLALVDLANKTWGDTMGNGLDIVLNSNTLNSAGMPSTDATGSNGRLVTMTKFNALCPNSFSIETSSWIGGNNYVWALNTSGASAYVYPCLNAFAFEAASGTAIAIPRNYACRHIVVTYDSTTNEYSVYLQGNKVSATVQRPSAFPDATNKHLRICGWGGNMGTVRVYNRVLTAAEVAQNLAYEQQYFTFTY